jgi:hypothetical protein
MAWTYFPVLEGLPLHCNPGSDRLPIVRLSRIANPSSCRECKKGICPKHQYGMTYELYDQRLLRQWTLSTVGFHARISQLQAFRKAWKEREAVLFSKYSDSSMKRKLPSYSLKTCQTLGPKEQSEFAKNWPKEGMIVGGVIYPLQMWERCTKW